MAKKETSHQPRAEQSSDKLPEPLVEASGLIKAGKQVYAWVRKRWGRVAAVAAVCLLGVVLVWWGWPELKERPGIEQLAEWFRETLTPIPTCSGHNFCVAVADFQNDSDHKFGRRIVDEVENLQDIVSPEGAKGQDASTGIEVIHIPRTISIVGNETRAAEAKAFVEAEHYLERSHADLVIWGVIIPLEEKSAPRLFWTTSKNKSQRSSELLNAEGFQLPEPFWHQLASTLQLVIVTQYTQVGTQEGRYVADKLLPFIKKVRALLPQTQSEGWTKDSQAQVKTTLANSLEAYAEQAGDNAALREAIGYYKDALLELTRERVPLDWATTQNHLGIALATLGARESDPADLKQAVTAFQQALLERTRERYPLDWAMTQNNLGGVLRMLGERDKDSVQLCKALEANTSAWQVFQGVAPFYASVTLKGAQEDLSVMSSHTSPTAYASCLANQAQVLKEMGLKTRM